MYFYHREQIKESFVSDLDPNKAQDPLMMRIHMPNICVDSTYKPVGLVFKTCVEHGVFPQS